MIDILQLPCTNPLILSARLGLRFAYACPGHRRFDAPLRQPPIREGPMTDRASLLLVFAAALVAAQCGGPLNPTGPSAANAPSIDVRGLDATSAGADAVRTLKRVVTGVVGDWKGRLILQEQDGDVFRDNVQLTLAEVA